MLVTKNILNAAFAGALLAMAGCTDENSAVVDAEAQNKTKLFLEEVGQDGVTPLALRAGENKIQKITAIVSVSGALQAEPNVEVCLSPYKPALARKAQQMELSHLIGGFSGGGMWSETVGPCAVFALSDEGLKAAVGEKSPLFDVSQAVKDEALITQLDTQIDDISDDKGKKLNVYVPALDLVCRFNEYNGERWINAAGSIFEPSHDTSESELRSEGAISIKVPFFYGECVASSAEKTNQRHTDRMDYIKKNPAP